MSKPSKLPVSVPGGDLVPPMRWQDFAPMAAHCWRDSGGYDRWKAIMEADADKFHELAMLLTKKTMPNTNINVNVGVEDLLDRLDREERGEIVDMTPCEVA